MLRLSCQIFQKCHLTESDLFCFILGFRTIHYYAELGQRSVFPTCEVPEHFVGQVTVLKYFSHYMEENLMDVSKKSLFLHSFIHFLKKLLCCCCVPFVFPHPVALEMLQLV